MIRKPVPDEVCEIHIGQREQHLKVPHRLSNFALFFWLHPRPDDPDPGASRIRRGFPSPYAEFFYLLRAVAHEGHQVLQRVQVLRVELIGRLRRFAGDAEADALPERMLSVAMVETYTKPQDQLTVRDFGGQWVLARVAQDRSWLLGVPGRKAIFHEAGVIVRPVREARQAQGHVLERKIVLSFEMRPKYARLAW